MPKYGFDHIHLISPEPLKTAKFYEDMFAATRVNTVKRPDGSTLVELSLDGSRILITQGQVQKNPPVKSSILTTGLDHFGIITDDIETTVIELKAKGAQFRDEIRMSRPGVRYIFMWAPENVLIELIERRV